MAAANVRRKCRDQRAGLQAGGAASQKKVLAYKPLCTYMYTHTYTHPLTHRPTHIPTVMHSTIFKVYTSISMPCPSQMVEDKEEGSQVNSASTGC